MMPTRRADLARSRDGERGTCSSWLPVPQVYETATDAKNVIRRASAASATADKKENLTAQPKHDRSGNLTSRACTKFVATFPSVAFYDAFSLNCISIRLRLLTLFNVTRYYGSRSIRAHSRLLVQLKQVKKAKGIRQAGNTGRYIETRRDEIRKFKISALARHLPGGATPVHQA